jgi:WD40 repeat protein
MVKMRGGGGGGGNNDNDSLMVSASQDGQIILWNLTMTTTPSHDHFVASLSNHTSEIGYALGVLKMKESSLLSRRVLVSGARDQFINIWNVNTGELIRQIATGKDMFALTVIENRGTKLR